MKIHYWGGEEASTWPGKDMTPVRDNVYYFVLPEGTTGVVFNNGNGIQSVDVTPTSNHLYRATSTTSKVDITDCGLWMTTAIETVEADTNAPAEYYNMQGHACRQSLSRLLYQTHRQQDTENLHTLITEEQPRSDKS